MEALLRQHARERAEWSAERERLLDRIMLLADKPLLPSFDAVVPAVTAHDDFVIDGYDDGEG